MKKPILILLLLLNSFFVMGQKQFHEELKNRFTELDYAEYIKSQHLTGSWTMTSWLTTYSCWGDNCNRIQYGLVSEGDTIPPYFTSIRLLSDSLVLFVSDGWATLTDKNLNILSHYETIFPLGNGDFAVKKNSLWGIMDNELQEKVAFKYDSLKPLKSFMFMDDEDVFLEHEIFFMPAKYNGKWGLTDYKKDSAVIPFIYDYLNFYIKDIYVIKNGKHGLLTIRNSISIPVEYDSIAQGMIRKGNLWSLDKQPFHFKYFAFTTPTMDRCRCLRSDEGWIMIDRDGNQITDDVYEDIKNYKVMPIPMKLKGKWGFVDCIQRKAITPFIYERVEKHYGYSAEVILNGELKTITLESY